MSFVWWKHGVLYQIYPRSFCDSTGNGTGDLDGIRQKLDHLEKLGVSGIWLSPCFVSPMNDFGYDVADYKNIDPLFGDNAALEHLLNDVHARGMKLLLDFVPNHTSDQHPWFQSALQGKDAPFRDFYVFKDPAPDGGPPNNWKSIFGGSAWKLDENSGQYFLHSYLDSQPDLDWRNPKVEEAMHDVVRFWFDKGVDGFRIDVIHRVAKDPLWRDNPVEVTAASYNGQTRVHDENHEDVHTFVRRLRAVVDNYDERALVGEIFLFSPETVAAYYGQGDELHLAFNFAFTRARYTADSFADEIRKLNDAVPDEGWPCWVLSNHDLVRHKTRYAHPTRPELDDDRARMLAMLLLFLPGTPFVYNGDEIGMRQQRIPDDKRQDPIWQTLAADESRDGCRTPMLWTAEAPGFGFTSADEAWLPLVDDGERTRSVEEQDADAGSMLQLYRDVIAMRQKHEVLTQARRLAIDVDGDVLTLRRTLDDGTTATGVFHFGDDAVNWPASLPTADQAVAHSRNSDGMLGAASAFWFVAKPLKP